MQSTNIQHHTYRRSRMMPLIRLNLHHLPIANFMLFFAAGGVPRYAVDSVMSRLRPRIRRAVYAHKPPSESRGQRAVQDCQPGIERYFCDCFVQYPHYPLSPNASCCALFHTYTLVAPYPCA